MIVHPSLAGLEIPNGRAPTVAEVNALLAEVIARRPLPEPVPEGERGGKEHKWKIRYRKVLPAAGRSFGTNPLTGLPYFSDPVFQKPAGEQRLWRIYVGMGCVNDEPACVQYLAQDDPRGWVMPARYGPYAKIQAVKGDGYAYVDRPLYEQRDGPFLLLTTPSRDGKDPGGFVEVADLKRPEFFRTKAMWDRKLYRADVVVTQTPYRTDPTTLNLALGGAVPRRWRVQVGKLPTKVQGAGVSAIDYVPLARMYLVRKEGFPEFDRLHVQQMCYWSLHSRSAVNQSLLELAAAVAELLALGNLSVLPFGLTGITAGMGLLAIEAALAALLAGQLEDLVAGISSVEFWSV